MFKNFIEKLEINLVSKLYSNDPEVKMPGTLIYAPYSPPSRGTLLTIRNLGLEIELKSVDIAGGEPRTDGFKKIK